MSNKLNFWGSRETDYKQGSDTKYHDYDCVCRQCIKNKADRIQSQKGVPSFMKATHPSHNRSKVPKYVKPSQIMNAPTTKAVAPNSSIHKDIAAPQDLPPAMRFNKKKQNKTKNPSTLVSGWATSSRPDVETRAAKAVASLLATRTTATNVGNEQRISSPTKKKKKKVVKKNVNL